MGAETFCADALMLKQPESKIANTIAGNPDFTGFFNLYGFIQNYLQKMIQYF
jgi:hypothetical protein